MFDPEKELLSLVRMSLNYFQQEQFVPEIVPSKKVEKKETPVAMPFQEKASTKAAPPVEIPRAPASSEKPKIKKTVEESKWPLQAMEPPEFHNLKDRFSHVFKTQPLFIPVKLVTREENEAHRLFLENVARTITRHFTPACVEMEKNFKWDAPLIMAPLSLARKKIPNIKPHHFYTIANRTLFVLEELDLYLNNRELKLILWNAIKTFPFQTLSQNLPPSS